MGKLRAQESQTSLAILVAFSIAKDLLLSLLRGGVREGALE